MTGDITEDHGFYEDTFFIVPRHITNLKGMKFSYLKVYEVIFQCWSDRRECRMNEDEFIQVTGLSDKQIHKALTFFVKNNKIIREVIDGKGHVISQPRQAICM